MEKGEIGYLLGSSLGKVAWRNMEPAFERSPKPLYRTESRLLSYRRERKTNYVQ